MSKDSYQVKNFYHVLKVSTTNTYYKLIQTVRLWYVNLVESVPFLIACAVFLSVISLKSPILLFCLLFGSLIAIVIHKIGRQVNLPKQWLIALQILAVAIVLSLFWLDHFAVPVQAQFFKRAEDFFKNNLTQGTTTNTSGTQAAVSLIFNVLRAIYLLYIAISLIGVINAVRKDEDWQSVARVPLLVVVAVTVADVLTGFVIGDSSK